MSLINCFGFSESKINNVKKITKDFYYFPRGRELFLVILSSLFFVPLVLYALGVYTSAIIYVYFKIKISGVGLMFFYAIFLIPLLNSKTIEISKEYLIVKESPFYLKIFWTIIERKKIKEILVNEHKTRTKSGTITSYTVDCILDSKNKTIQIYESRNFYESDGLAKTLRKDLELEKTYPSDVFVLE